mmetsp:Transcript_14553/g.20807  ORF Transcript_14553/g.20807 Transcript_14553/m.20807 type:complete len:222 (+) Transcript_14553:872-1537(+)
MKPIASMKILSNRQLVLSMILPKKHLIRLRSTKYKLPFHQNRQNIQGPATNRALPTTSLGITGTIHPKLHLKAKRRYFRRHGPKTAYRPQPCRPICLTAPRHRNLPKQHPAPPTEIAPGLHRQLPHPQGSRWIIRSLSSTSMSRTAATYSPSITCYRISVSDGVWHFAHSRRSGTVRAYAQQPSTVIRLLAQITNLWQVRYMRSFRAPIVSLIHTHRFVIP